MRKVWLTDARDSNDQRRGASIYSHRQSTEIRCYWCGQIRHIRRSRLSAIWNHLRWLRMKMLSRWASGRESND